MRLLGLMIITVLVFNACGTSGLTEYEEVPVETVQPAVWIEDDIYPSPTQAPPPEPEPDLPPVFPNEIGEIMIIVYHGLHEYNPGTYDRLTSEFKNDLQMLYDRGYRLISMADLINNNIRTPKGYTPVVLSFDDGLPSAFSMIELEDGTLAPKPGTAVYIINNFYEKNPDFGRTAIFFVNGRPEPFNGAGTLEERFQFLIEHGYELGNHSYSHAFFSRHNAQSLQRDMGLLDQMLRRYAPGFEPLVMAYPYSVRPRCELFRYVLNGEYNGVPYSYAWALRVGNTGSPAVPYHINFDPFNVSRVVASDASTEYYIVPDLGHLLRLFDEFPGLRFISDGDPYTVTVPRHLEDYVNIYALYGKELIFYDLIVECDENDGYYYDGCEEYRYSTS